MSSNNNNIIKYPDNVRKPFLIKKKKINYSKFISFVIIFIILCFIIFNLKLKNDESFRLEKEINKVKTEIISSNQNIDDLKKKINSTKIEINKLNKSLPELKEIKSILNQINTELESNKKEKISKIIEIQKKINESTLLLNNKISNNKLYKEEKNKKEKKMKI